MKVNRILLLLACLVAIVSMLGCTKNSNESTSGDWASNFVVWQGNMYNASKDTVEVEELIGEVEEYSDSEATTPTESKVFSNKYPVGTKIYKIKDTTIEQAIAIEIDGKYIKANNAGKYGS